MQVGDLVVIDPYWRSRSHIAWSDFDPTWRRGQKGTVLGFTQNWKGLNKVVVHLFDEERDYFYYSPQHVRTIKEIPQHYKSKHKVIGYESW